MVNNELFPESVSSIPEKWYVERNKSNYLIVNELFSILYKRKYTDNGVMRYHYNGEWHVREQDYMHYPRVNRTTSKNSKSCVFTEPKKGYKRISVEQLKAFVMQQEIQDNWYIRGCSELVELMADKSLNDGVYQGMNPTQGYYIPRFSEEPTKWHSWSASELRARGMKEISVQQFKDLVLSTKPFVMPEKWYIRGGNNDLMTYLKYKGSGYSGKEKDYGYYPNEYGYWAGNHLTFLEADRVEITYAQFFNSLNKKETTMVTTPKLIGYKLKVSKYNKAALAIAGLKSWSEGEYMFADVSTVAQRLKEADVLDKWFEPVYETAPELPEIKGKDGKMYKGTLKGNVIVYGCAELNVDWFRSSATRHIKSFYTNNNVFIEAEVVKAIRKYLSYHEPAA